MKEELIKYKMIEDGNISCNQLCQIFKEMAKLDHSLSLRVRDWFVKEHDVILTSKRVIENAAKIFGLEWDMWDNPPDSFVTPKGWSNGVPYIKDIKKEFPLTFFYIRVDNRLFVFKPEPWIIKFWNSTGEHSNSLTSCMSEIFDGYINVAHYAGETENYFGSKKTASLSIKFQSLR